MRIYLKLTITIVFVISLVSCKKDNNMDMSFLQDYYFIFNGEWDFENGHSVNNDTIVFSFEQGDTVLSVRHYYEETISGENQYIKTDTVIQKYVLDGNIIEFEPFDWQYYNLQNNNNSLWNIPWEVTFFDNKYLKINKYSRGQYSLSCVKK